MRYLLMGAIAPAALMAATPVDARPARVDIPIQIDPNASVYVLWVKVKAEGDHTIVSGYVRQKRWFARSRGHLHIAFLRQGQQVACQESDWKKYRYRSRGQWRFTSSVQIAASAIDSVQISHVDHDRVPDSTLTSMTACPGLTVGTEQHPGGA
jgi:hypothetical protein